MVLLLDEQPRRRILPRLALVFLDRRMMTDLSRGAVVIRIPLELDREDPLSIGTDHEFEQDLEEGEQGLKRRHFGDCNRSVKRGCLRYGEAASH